MTDDGTIVLITGANKGLGLTTARRLAEGGATVLLGSRDADRGREAAASLAGLPVVPITIDVTDDASVEAAAEQVGETYGRLDVLVNNAGVAEPHRAAAETTADDMASLYDVNVFGPVRATRAFLPLLERSSAPRVVMVSSGLGSNTRLNDPATLEGSVASRLGLAYPSSKAALVTIAGQYARSLPWLRVDAVDPGYTATDLNANSGTQTLEEGTDAIVAAATTTSGPTARFFDRDGEVPW